MNVSLPLNGFKSFYQLNIVFKFAGPVVKLLLHICDVMFCGKYVIKILICLPGKARIQKHRWTAMLCVTATDGLKYSTEYK